MFLIKTSAITNGDTNLWENSPFDFPSQMMDNWTDGQGYYFIPAFLGKKIYILYIHTKMVSKTYSYQISTCYFTVALILNLLKKIYVSCTVWVTVMTADNPFYKALVHTYMQMHKLITLSYKNSNLNMTRKNGENHLINTVHWYTCTAKLQTETRPAGTCPCSLAYFH